MTNSLSIRERNQWAISNNSELGKSYATVVLPWVQDEEPHLTGYLLSI